MATDTTDHLVHREYDADHYETLTESTYVEADFKAALQAASVHTLVRAFDYAISEMLDHYGVVCPLRDALRRRHGFTDDDFQFLAEGLNPASPSARAALGLDGPAPLVAHAETGEAVAKIFPMETPAITQPTLRLPADLPDHPLLAHIPVWRDDEPEFQSLKASIAERGLDYLVLIDSAGRVVDGRNRRNACAALGREVPVRTVPDEEVSEIIVSALACRRHMSKAAIAYVLFPLIHEQLEKGVGIFGKPLPKSKRWSEVAGDAIGVNERYLRSAQTIHEQLARRPELRGEIELQVFAEGGADLCRIAQGNGGRESTRDKARNPPQPGALFTRAITDLRNRFVNFWPKIEPTLRLSVADELADTLLAAPPEVRARIVAKLKEAA